MFVTATLALLIVALPRLDQLRWWRRKEQFDEQRFYAAVHSELRAGASLRRAVAEAATAQDCRALAAVKAGALGGASIAEIAGSLQSLPSGGRRAAMALQIAAQTGGRAADVFLRLADRAAPAADIARQRRTLTTQSRLSAAVVAGLPVAWLAFGGVGRLGDLISSGGALLAGVGLAMQLIGVAMVWRLASA